MYILQKNEESLHLLIKALNLKKPSKQPYVCSFCFKDTRRTEDHPISGKLLGYDASINISEEKCPLCFSSTKTAQLISCGYIKDIHLESLSTSITSTLTPKCPTPDLFTAQYNNHLTHIFTSRFC